MKHTSWYLGLAAFVVMFAYLSLGGPAPGHAQVCNGLISIGYEQLQNPNVQGSIDSIRINLGAGEISAEFGQPDPALDVASVSFDLDCDADAGPFVCQDDGDIIGFVATAPVSSTCSGVTWTATTDGNPANLHPGGASPNRVIFVASPPALVFPNSFPHCSLDFQVEKLTSISSDSTPYRVEQAAAFENATCRNGLGASASQAAFLPISTPTPTPTSTSAFTPTPSPTAAATDCSVCIDAICNGCPVSENLCPCDDNGDGAVTVDELITNSCSFVSCDGATPTPTSITPTPTPSSCDECRYGFCDGCPAGDDPCPCDLDGNGAVSLSEMIQNGCEVFCGPAPTATPSSECGTRPVNGLVSLWKAEGDTLDSVGSNHGTAINGATFGTGLVGSAFSFDGIDDHVEVPDHASLGFDANEPMTIELWALGPGSGTEHLIGKRTSCSGNDFNYQVAFDSGFVFGGVLDLLRVSERLPANIWTHLAGVVDANTIRFYVDGELVGERSGVLGPINSAPFKIGAAGQCNNQKFTGLIDEVGLYARALSQQEIRNIIGIGDPNSCDPNQPSGTPTPTPTAAESPFCVDSLTGGWTGDGVYTGGELTGATFDFVCDLIEAAGVLSGECVVNDDPPVSVSGTTLGQVVGFATNDSTFDGQRTGDSADGTFDNPILGSGTWAMTRTAGCGDGTVSSATGEQCDDANCVNGDGCDDSCNSEVSTPTPTAMITNTAIPSATATETPIPTATATATNTVTPTPVCGDGVVAGGEECDPGEDVEGDCCTATCLLESPGAACNADDESCTADTCDGEGTCNAGAAAENGASCDDGDACTGPDTCSDGTCSGAAVDCNDGLDCTVDSCNPAVGCLHIGTVEDRSCPGTCSDGINNDPNDPNDPLHDPNNPDSDGDVDFEDTGCATLAQLGRFAIVGTRDRSHRDLKLGTNTTAGSFEVNGTCNAGDNLCDCPETNCEPSVNCSVDADCSVGTCNTSTNQCECTLDCATADTPCVGDRDCLFDADGTCDLGSNLCECPSHAPNCQPLNRPCDDDADCAVSPFPGGPSTGGVCGNGMLISAGTEMGVLASVSTDEKIQFGTARSGDGSRLLDVQQEFANAGGPLQLSDPAPFLGPTVCSDDTNQTCLFDADCTAGLCNERRRIGDGSAFESSDGDPDAGLAGAGSSENFKRCDVAITQLESGGASSPSVLQAAIEAYSPDPNEVLTLGAGNCLLCPATTSADGACAPCDPATDQIRTRARHKKVIITADSGLQVLDLERIILSGRTWLVIRGEADTELLVRVDRQIRSGAQSKLILEGMTADQVLFVGLGRFGGKPLVSRSATWRGSILATERNAGIYLGATSYVEGGIYGKRILVKGPDTTVQHFPWRGKLPSVP